MCGIAGFFRYRDDALLRTMTDKLRHRGPDSDGYFSNDVISLGMRRLAVLDVKGGDQPLFNENRRVVAVYNGEIYNFKELRGELIAKGHIFHTRTDSEVLVHLYEEMGVDLVKRLNGMFAFALWDDEKKQLLLARDQLGIKPLYYAEMGERLAFTSEIKALLPFPDLSRDISHEAVASYLTRGSIPAPLSIFRSIKKLPPAHRLIASPDGVRVERYWDVPRPDEAADVDLSRIEHLLDAAVEKQLVSDVPLGVFLSGGLDSGTLAALASRRSDGPLKTFTIGYAPPDESYNELEPARHLAKHFGCDHHEAVLTPNIRDLIAPLARGFDEPFADSSAVPTFLVSREARQHVTVALAGVGGDELFGGYPRYLGLLWAERAKRIPPSLRRLGARMAEFIPDRGGHINWTGRIKRFLRDAERPLAEQYARWTSILSPDLIPAEWRTAASGASEGAATPSDAALRDLSSYLPDDLLCLSDRMSMAHSLEVRVPFLDLPLVEHMARVPLERKLAGGKLKALLKKIMEPRLPPGHLDQPKRGFSIPLARWLREDLKDVLEDALSPQRVKERGYLDPAVVSRLREAHDLGRENNGDALWMMLMLEMWHRENAVP